MLKKHKNYYFHLLPLKIKNKYNFFCEFEIIKIKYFFFTTAKI